MATVSEDVGQVLVQRASQRHVEHLCAAADAKYRQPPLERVRDEREFPCVAIVAGIVGLRVWRLPIPCRVNVLAAGYHQTVQSVQHAVGDLVVDGLRWQKDGDTARQGHALEIDVRQEACPNVPYPRLGLLEVGGHAHDGV